MTDKSYSSTKKFKPGRKEENKQKNSNSRKSKTEKTSKASQATQCLVYGHMDSTVESETVTPIGGRDTALFLFRALGKILYCKSECFVFNRDMPPNVLQGQKRL